MPIPLPPTDGDRATESTRPILTLDLTQSLYPESGSASSSGSDSGPNSLQMANPDGTPSTTGVRQNCPGSEMASSKSASEM